MTEQPPSAGGSAKAALGLKSASCGALNSMGGIMGTAGNATSGEPWNKGKIVGRKAPFKLKKIRALRVRLQMEGRVGELALFNLGIDSKLRG